MKYLPGRPTSTAVSLSLLMKKCNSSNALHFHLVVSLKIESVFVAISALKYFLDYRWYDCITQVLFELRCTITEF